MMPAENKFIYYTHLEQYVGTEQAVAIPEGVEVIDSLAFRGNMDITAITFPASIKEIAMDAFADFTNLETVAFACRAETLSIGYGSFRNCLTLQSVKLPEGTVSIYETAFKNCTALSDITLPNSIKYISEFAFPNCISLKKLKLPSNLQFISRNCFQGCIGLTEIVIPEGIKDIWEHAFQACESLSDVQIPSGVIHIGEETFAGCKSLSHIYIPNSVKSIGKKAFAGCAKGFVLESSNPQWKAYAQKEKLKFALIDDPYAK